MYPGNCTEYYNRDTSAPTITQSLAPTPSPVVYNVFSDSLYGRRIGNYNVTCNSTFSQLSDDENYYIYQCTNMNINSYNSNLKFTHF